MKKKILHIVIYCLYPFLLSAVYTFMLLSLKNVNNANAILKGFFAICCFIPLYGFAYFIKKRPFNQWILPIGFIPVPLLPFIYEYNRPGWFQYLGTALALYFYVFPFILISIIIALIITIENERKK